MSKLKTLSLVILLLVGLAMLLNGCATVVRNLTKSDQEAIAGEKKSVVLLRLSAEIDSKKLQGPERFKSRIACIDTGQSPKSIFLYDSPSAEAQRDGWVYFILEPGTYYLSVSPKLETMPNYFSPNFFWFHVSQGNQVIYVGTLTAACETSGGFLIGRPIGVCSKVQVINQTESAKVIVQALFNRFAPMSSAIMKPVGKPINTRSINELVPMGFMTTSAKSLLSPDWKARAVESANRTAMGVFAVGGAYGVAAYILYGLPLTITGGAIAGEIAEHKWQPTIQGLQQELQENNLADMLGSAFENTLSKYGASRPINLNQADNPFAQAKQQGLKSIFQTEILKIELSECVKHGSFCVAITLRTRLWETTSQTLVYDSVLRYSDDLLESPESKTFFYVALDGECECRKMEDYGGAEGRKLFKEELSKAIQSSMQRFFNDVVKEKLQ